MRCNSTISATPGASTRRDALFDNRWSGKNSSTAPPWSAVGRRGMVQWAEDQRDSRCSAHPLLRRAAGAPHHGAIAQRLRASGCRPEGCGFESRWSRCLRSLSSPSGARAVPHSPRAGGAAGGTDCTLGDGASSISHTHSSSTCIGRGAMNPKTWKGRSSVGRAREVPRRSLVRDRGPKASRVI